MTSPTKRFLKLWTPEEDKILIDNFSKKSLKEIVALLPGRSIGSVAGRISSLRLTKKNVNEARSRGITLHPQPGLTVHYAVYRDF